MTIEQYSFRPGVLVPKHTPEAFQELLIYLVSNNRDRRRILPTGTYNLTPDFLLTGSDHFRFILNAKEDGTGVLTFQEKDFIKGILHLPADLPMAGILHQYASEPVRVYEIVAHAPDFSPIVFTRSQQNAELVVAPTRSYTV